MKRGDVPGAQRVDHFGRILKFWRNTYGLSQEELAFRINSASRHISRLEKGDARPSEEMVERIAKAMSLGYRDSVNLLFSAGYTKVIQDLDPLSPEFSYRREEIVLGLKALEPNPSIVVDMTGQVQLVNRAWVTFQDCLDPEGHENLSNIFDFLFNYADRTSTPQDWAGTLSVLMLSLQQLIYFYGDEDNRAAALIERLQESKYLPENWQRYAAERQGGQRFRVNVIIDGEERSFLVHSYIEKLFGPLTFTAMPDLVVMAFCPEDESFDQSRFMSKNQVHPLLFY